MEGGFLFLFISKAATFMLMDHDSLIQYYPNYEQSMRESLRILVGAEVEKRVEIGMAKDGSGVGGQPSFPFILPLRCSDPCWFVQLRCVLFKLSSRI